MVRVNDKILLIFWSNVEWYLVAKRLTWTALVGGQAALARRKKYNVSLRKVAEIAEMLEISDIQILFEPLITCND